MHILQLFPLLKMYRSTLFSARKILIVKTSALGDIIQSFIVLHDLKRRFPDAAIDWVVEKHFAPLVLAHPLIHRAIAIDSKAWKRCAFSEYFRAATELRRERYDCVFDLQGNCKSGVVTLLSKSRCKVGFGKKSVREWPNLVATHHRFNAPPTVNIRLQLLSLVRQFLGDPEETALEGLGVRFKISEDAKQQLEKLLARPEAAGQERIMVSPGTKWRNKQLPLATLASFLNKVSKAFDVSFFFTWGDGEEKLFCEELCQRLDVGRYLIVDRLELPVWQNLMAEMSAVIAFDSGALHLCGTTATPSFGIFGPTLPEIFMPIGQAHGAMRGECPYSRRFEKLCPLLRTCPTGACIRSLTADEIFSCFCQWRKKVSPTIAVRIAAAAKSL